MKTEKKDNKKENGAHGVGVRAPQLDGREYLGRVTSLHGAVTLIDDLREKKPDGMGELVDGAFEKIDVLAPVVQRAADQQTNKLDAKVADTRFAMLGAVAKVTGPLDTFAASAVEELAVEAGAVLQGVFGNDRADLAKMRPKAALGAMTGVKGKLETQPGLRKRLEALIPRVAVAEMLKTHAAFADALRASDAYGEQALDGRAVLTRLNARIDFYALCVLSTADPDDLQAAQRAATALRPLLLLRADNARRRGKKSVVEPTTPEPDETPAEVTPPVVAPVVTEVEGDDG